MSEALATMPFEFHGHTVRTVQDPDGTIWWVASDIAKILGYREARDMTRNVHQNTLTYRVITSENVPDQGKPHNMRVGDESYNRRMTVLNEPGLYEAILKARVPVAEEFQYWVTHDVLPTIRRTGAYGQPLTGPALMAAALEEAHRTLQALETDRAAMTAELAVTRPKALFADAVATSHTSILIGELAKILKGNGVPVGATRLFRILREHGYLCKQRGDYWNTPTQRAMELGLFEVKESTVVHADGHTTLSRTTKVTGKGQQYFINRFLDGRIPATAPTVKEGA